MADPHALGPPRRDQLDAYVSEAPFFQRSGSSLPIYARRNIALGAGAVLFVEQRSWLNFIGVDGVVFRKKEKERKVVEKVVSDFNLSAHDCYRLAT